MTTNKKAIFAVASNRFQLNRKLLAVWFRWIHFFAKDDHYSNIVAGCIAPLINGRCSWKRPLEILKPKGTTKVHFTKNLFFNSFFFLLTKQSWNFLRQLFVEAELVGILIAWLDYLTILDDHFTDCVNYWDHNNFSNIVCLKPASSTYLQTVFFSITWLLDDP